MERTPRRTYPLRLILFILLVITVPAPQTLGIATEGTIAQSHETTIEMSQTITTIQDVINQAQPGTVLQLPAGVYSEILTIDKPLHLKGEDSTRTIINPTSPNNGYAIRITAEGVILTNLDISNQGPGLYTTGVKISASNTTIQQCRFHDTPIGIALWSSTNTISGCDFTGCGDEGIVLLGTPTTPCTNNTITACTFYKNCDGIELQYATHNHITSCTFTENTHAGIDAIASDNNNNIISQCEFFDNQGFGLYLTRSSQNLITRCSFSDDTVSFVHASENTLFESQVTSLHLLENSSLLIRQCTDIDDSTIISKQSSYSIFSDNPEQISKENPAEKIIHHSVLFTILSRFKIIKSVYEQLTQLRM
jgi:parallel beta-helix repeat protein